jgi:hypothetical protein
MRYLYLILYFILLFESLNKGFADKENLLCDRFLNDDTWF